MIFDIKHGINVGRRTYDPLMMQRTSYGHSSQRLSMVLAIIL